MLHNNTSNANCTWPEPALAHHWNLLVQLIALWPQLDIFATSF